MNHREERDFTLRLHLSAEFPADYDGDDDGFAWHEDFQARVRPRIVAAVFAALAAVPGFRAVAAPRGADPEDGVDLEVSRVRT
jgi:hypothetical protein